MAVRGECEAAGASFPFLWPFFLDGDFDEAEFSFVTITLSHLRTEGPTLNDDSYPQRFPERRPSSKIHSLEKSPATAMALKPLLVISE
jgi:hypothetical protein